MSVLLTQDALRVDVEPTVERAVRWRVLNAEQCDARVAGCVTRIGARP